MRKFLLPFVFAFIFSPHNLNSQNLITNGDFGIFNAAVFSPPPLGYTTTYTQMAYNDVNASVTGKYSITNNPSALAPGVLSSFFDHTTDNGVGNMMYVDGKNNQVFWKQDQPLTLQAGVTYILTYWVRNANQTVGGPSPAPTISFNPVGCTSCVSQTFNTGVSKQWIKVSYSITPIVTESVSIELSTVGAVASGNNFVIDDISLIPPIVPMTASFVSTNPSCPNVNDGSIVVYSNSGIPSYTFNLTGSKTDTNSTGVFTGLEPGTYVVSVTDSALVPVTITSSTITLVGPPDMNLSSSASGCVAPSSSVTLTASNGGPTYNWSASTGVPISSTSASVIVTPAKNTTYTVTSSRSIPNTNLITNGDFESGISGFFSDYVYTATSASLTQFDYGITNNPSSWDPTFISSTDKSGTGKMLVTKGATTLNKTIWSQTVLVDNSKLYTFEFYVQNAVATSPAQFRVLINGVQITISPLSATNAGSPGWTRISGTWNSGLSSTAKIQIIDTNIALAGNDFAIDDISFSTLISKSCDISAQVTINVEVNPITDFSYQTPICKSAINNPKPSPVIGFETGGIYSESTGLLPINPITGEINLATSPSGTFTIRYSVGSIPDVCQLAGFSTFNITIDSTLPLPAVVSPIDYCINTSATSLTSTALDGASLNWYGKNETGGVASSTPDIPLTSSLGSTTYYVSQSIGACESSRSAIIVRVSESIVPVFTAIPVSICSNSTSLNLPTTSNNGIRGSWLPSTINNKETTTYIFTPDSGQCGITKSITIEVNSSITPGFNPIASICSGDFLSPLPTTSINGILGVWSPALNNLTTTTYTFTPTSGQCATNASIEIVVNPKITPTFSPITPICSGDILLELPNSSLNEIIGTWSPALNNTATTIYTFTPNPNQCSTTASLTINVTPNSIPTFTVINSYCEGSSIPSLPLLSNNGVTGTWSPAINNTTTTTYTFIPNAGQCASTSTLTIDINSIETPLFTPIDPICAGTIIEPLLTTSTNGISGTWAPVFNNRLTTEYSFTPNVSQCGIPVKLTVIVNPNTTPIFDPISPICLGDVLPPLPTTSTNGIKGVWSPSLDNTITTTYNFTPSIEECATSQTLTISVNSIPEFSVSGTCDGTDFLLKINQQNDTNNLTYSWYNSLNEKIGSSSIIKIEQKGNYRVDVEDGNKCKAVRDVEVNNIYCDIPKGISPNNDQRNDSFDLRNLGVSKLEIFDRYGLKVYSKFDYNSEWDGTSDKGQQLPDGTYYYIVEFKSGKSKTGWVYLNREH